MSTTTNALDIKTQGQVYFDAVGNFSTPTITQHAPVIADTNNKIKSTAALTDGQLLIGSSGADPVPATLTAGSNVTVTNGSGSISIAVAGSTITGINGDTGSATGNPFTIKTGNSSNNSGASVKFVASGAQVQLNVTDASGNTFYGNLCGSTSVSGTNNTGFGQSALAIISSGSSHTAIGYNALSTMTTGNQNTAVGALALTLATGGSNVALGYNTGSSLTTGASNTFIGANAGSNYTSTENSCICINNTGTVGDANVLRIGAGTGTGTQQINSTFICGINGINVTGSTVLVSTSDQLGITVSSERFKENITPMGNSSTAIMDLEPVNFYWKEWVNGDHNEMQYGLIAEEVHKIFPYLVIYDKENKPFSVKYHEIPAILLNEFKKRNNIIQDLLKESRSWKENEHFY